MKKLGCAKCGGQKMAVGGTTTKRIIKKSTGGMYGIPQENMGTSSQYGFGRKGGAKAMLAEAPVLLMKKGGSTSKNWIQKAVNPKHKGYCTPMSKPTCTPKRKALARTFKAMAKNR